MNEIKRLRELLEEAEIIAAAKDRKIAALREALRLAMPFVVHYSDDPQKKAVVNQIRIILGDPLAAASPAPDPAEAMPVNEWPNKDLVVKRTKADGTVDYPTIGELHKAIAALKGNGEGL